MNFDIAGTLQFISVAAIPMLFAITVHEAAHGWMAGKFGDRTAEMLGRLTLNPGKHIDPVGTIIVPLLMVMTSGFFFGWAKPVPVNSRNLRHPKRDMVAVAFAGPGANFCMALIWAGIYQAVTAAPQWFLGAPEFFASMARIGVFFNFLLMTFNLLPILPLDGGRVLRGLVSEPFGRQLDAFERYGFIIVIGLLFFGLLGPVLVVAARLTALLGVPV